MLNSYKTLINGIATAVNALKAEITAKLSGKVENALATAKAAQATASQKADRENAWIKGNLYISAYGWGDENAKNSCSVGRAVILCDNSYGGRAVNAAFAAGGNTTAASDLQFVHGKNNIPDYDGKYAHIIGNGYYNDDSFSPAMASNAYTLDWNGTPWYQSRPQFGGNAQDDGSQTVIANGDKVIILTSSTEGSSKQFKITVDDEGTISATEVTTS